MSQRPARLTAEQQPQTTVLVAVGPSRVREALVAMLGTLDSFRVVAEADADEAAVEAARAQRPQLALVEPELSNGGGWWVIQQIESQHLAGVVVAIGQRADGALARLVGARSYVQMGASSGDLLNALQAAIAWPTPSVSAVAEAEHHLLANANPVLDKPSLVDL